MKREEIDKFIRDQISRWPLACENFRALKGVETKSFRIGKLEVRAQFNPARIISSAAKTDKSSLQQRKCFLCRENRPPQQTFLKYEGRKGKKYDILVNPYPIFADHLVIALNSHTDQSITDRYVDILDLSRACPGFTFFYNGPHCGASAPDHHHFQACNNNEMPLEVAVDRLIDEIPRDERGNYIFDNGREGAGTWTDSLKYLSSIQDAHLYHYKDYLPGVFVIRSRTVKSSAKMFYRLLDCAPMVEGDAEPRFNLFTYYRGAEYRSIVVFRRSHRSHHYFTDGPDHLTMSPGCADMAGILPVPMVEDWEKLSSALLTDMLTEVSLTPEQQDEIVWKMTRTQPTLEVGIVSGQEICFEMVSDGAGVQRASYREGKIDYNGTLYDELFFEAQTPSKMLAEPTFILHDVVIGVGFHWERKETQKFAGSLKIIVENHRLTAVNIVGVEDYLLSVISSEMKSTSSEEFLKAHAVISRSWVMARILGRRAAGNRHEFPQDVHTSSDLVTWLSCRGNSADTPGTPSDELVKWYDHEDHKNFDVCADDHCQRYQGLTRALGATVRKAIDATWGQVLTYDGQICDARFSKCCGGRMETFSTCWEDKDYPYLQALPDTPDHDPGAEPFCAAPSHQTLVQVLNSYDRETNDFYEWTIDRPIGEVSELLRTKSGRDIGEIKALIPLERGESGRIKLLRIEGDKGTFTVGKELEIRRILSESHLKSSAFDASISDGRLVLRGRGWGHGVGLCQIGAAVMASKGYDYRQILGHYYPGAKIDTRKQ